MIVFVIYIPVVGICADGAARFLFNVFSHFFLVLSRAGVVIGLGVVLDYRLLVFGLVVVSVQSGLKLAMFMVPSTCLSHGVCCCCFPCWRLGVRGVWLFPACACPVS